MQVASPFALACRTLADRGVQAFGWVETVGGALKVILVFGVSCILYNIARKKDAGGPTGPINDGFKNNASFATTPFKAFCYAFPLAAYGFLGIETTVMAAYEARTAKSIARPSQWVHWVVFVLYFMCTIGLALNVPWDHDHLPSMLARLTKQTTPPFSTSATVIAVYSDNPGLAAFLNGCLIFSVVSAANTALYVASRTLYGLTYNLGDGLLARRFKGASTIWDATGVPAAALFLTVLSFYWLPWLMLIGNFAIDDLIKIVSLSSSVACLIVWAALCLAFHRFEKWCVFLPLSLPFITNLLCPWGWANFHSLASRTRLCAPALVAQHPDLARFVRGSALYRKRVFNVLSWGQPWVARLGLVGCIVVWVLASATWWDTPVSVQKVAAAYGTHIVLFLFWVGLKLSQGKFRPGTWWVPMTTGSNPKDLISRLRRLERLSEKGEDRGRNRYGASADRPRASSFAWEVPVTEASGTPPHLKGLASPGNVTVDSRGG